MRAKLLRLSGEALIDLLHGRLWVRNLPADAFVARIGMDVLTDCLTVTLVSDSFPEHLPYNTLEVLTPELVNPTPLVSWDPQGAVLAVGLTRWLDPASPEAKAAVAAIKPHVVVTGV